MTVPPEAPEAPTSAPSVRIRLFGRSDVGQVREHNEDSFVWGRLSESPKTTAPDATLDTELPAEGVLLGVCDGMGGAAAGEVASQLAVDLIFSQLRAAEPRSRDELARSLNTAIEQAGRRIFDEARKDKSRKGMGTTATIALIANGLILVGQVGDSRGYMLRGPRLVQLTRDQSLVNQLIEAGQLTEEEAESFEHANIILQALGTAETVQVDLTSAELRRGDRVLFCSDGLSGMVKNDEIREVLGSAEDPAHVVNTLIERANQAGGHDNVTVLVAFVDGDGLPDCSEADVAGLAYKKFPLPEDGPPVSVLGPPLSGPPDVEVREAGDVDLVDIERAERALPSRFPNEEPVNIPTGSNSTAALAGLVLGGLAAVALIGYYFFR